MNHHTAVLFNGQALCLILMASTAVFNGALSASPSFVLMGLCLLYLVALPNQLCLMGVMSA